MKSAYELAMERLSKQSPSVKLTAEQKEQIADLESRYKAKVAEKELSLTDAINAAAAKGDFEEMEKLKEQLVIERKKLADDLEEKKAAVRQQTR